MCSTERHGVADAPDRPVADFDRTILRPKLWERMESVRPAEGSAAPIILLFVYAGFASGVINCVAGELFLRFLAACVALHVILLGVMAVMSGLLKLSWPDRTAVVLCGSQKTLPNGITFGAISFPPTVRGRTVGAVSLFQLIVDTLLVSSSKTQWCEERG